MTRVPVPLAAAISRRRALQGLAAAAFTGSVTAAWAKAADPALTFLAVGDWGRDGQDNQADVARQMGLVAAAVGARFVISVGDNFYEDGVASVSDPKWKTSFEDVYSAPSLQVPWHVALGNHDYHGDSQAQLDYAATSHRWRLPARWYSRQERAPDGTTMDLFVLDTSPFIRGYYEDGAEKVKVAGQDTEAQLRWFAAALAASRADWKVVVGHHPVYSGGKHGGSPDLQARIDPLLQQHRVALYLNGHDHDLQHVHHGAAHYVCTGAGSKMRDHCDDTDGSDFCSLHPGFTALRLTRAVLQVAYRDAVGAELKVVDIPRPA
jgi:tartrate-resistant acid phosphatase type 5